MMTGINYYHYIRWTIVIATLAASQFSWSAHIRDSWDFNPIQSQVKHSLVGWYSGEDGNPTDINHILTI